MDTRCPNIIVPQSVGKEMLTLDHNYNLDTERLHGRVINAASSKTTQHSDNSRIHTPTQSYQTRWK